MDKDKVIELAKRADLIFEEPHCDMPSLQRYLLALEAFAQLVRDDYRAELLAGSGEPVGYLAWRDGKPSWDEDCVCKDPVYPVDETDDRTSKPIYTAEQLAAAVLRERNTCLEIADQFADADLYASMVSNAIRARK